MIHPHGPAKLTLAEAPAGRLGETLLIRGRQLGLRMWDEGPAATPKPEATRPYETVGYVLSGHARLVYPGGTLDLGPGDSYLVPRETPHRYEILEPFIALEATSPAQAPLLVAERES